MQTTIPSRVKSQNSTDLIQDDWRGTCSSLN